MRWSVEVVNIAPNLRLMRFMGGWSVWSSTTGDARGPALGDPLSRDFDMAIGQASQ